MEKASTAVCHHLAIDLAGAGMLLAFNKWMFQTFFGFIALLLILPLTSQAQVASCKATDAGLYYKDGVKQCLYHCVNACDVEEDLIGPSHAGDFGAYNCFGAIVVIQPSMNGQLSPNAVGFRNFNVSLHGIGAWMGPMLYGDLFHQLRAKPEFMSCVPPFKN